MAACCGRLSKLYVIISNLLFSCLGVAYIAFGVLGSRNKFLGATLFPHLIFKLSAILGAIIMVASIIGFTAAFSRRRLFIYLYILVILMSLAVQVIIGVKMYKATANSNQYLLTTWSSASENEQSALQKEFSCCGYDGFKGGLTVDQCSASSPPCANSLRSYVHNVFQKVYLITFSALALQLLAISNAITMICSQHIHSDEFEDERHERRKSGIRLDDMVTVNAPTKSGSFNQYIDDSQNRYDSYHKYKHNSNANEYSHHY
ncbi:unnamed protein product [Absidia cylindrospora]